MGKGSPSTRVKSGKLDGRLNSDSDFVYFIF